MFSSTLYVVPVVRIVTLVLITASVKILREYERAVVFTLGRFQAVKSKGRASSDPSPRAIAAAGDRRNCHRIFQASSTKIRVLHNLLIFKLRRFAGSLSRTASLTIRDILFHALGPGLKGAECGPLRPSIRTMRGGRQAHLARFSVSPRPLSLTQLNHARFGTDVRTARTSMVRGGQKACGFERAALRRGEQGSKRSTVWYGNFLRSPHSLCETKRRAFLA